MTDLKTPRGILETIVYSRDLAAAREFYEQIIGLIVVAYEPERHLMLRVGRSMLLIFHPDDSRTKEISVRGSMIPQHGCDGCSHFAFEIAEEQFVEIKQNLTRHGIPIESEIRWPSGGHSLYCRDPANNSVEFATATLWFDDKL